MNRVFRCRFFVFALVLALPALPLFSSAASNADARCVASPEKEPAPSFHCRGGRPITEGLEAALIRGAQAEPNPACSVSPELIRELVTWIGGHTAYDVSKTLADPPEISFCREGEVIDYESDHVLVDEMLRAAFDLQSRRIFLVQPWNAANPRNLSTLLHELIHDVQHLNRDWACKGEPEWEAYKLQEAWLAEQGIESRFDWMFIFVISRCRPAVHAD